MEVLPENWASLMFFIGLQTQWSWAVGAAGGNRTGLRYEAVYPLLDRWTKGEPEEWERLFADVQHMEMAVLQIPSKK